MTKCRYCGNETGDTYPVCGAYVCIEKENKEDIASLPEEPHLSDKLVIGFLVFVVLYFGAHLFTALFITHNLSH